MTHKDKIEITPEIAKAAAALAHDVRLYATVEAGEHFSALVLLRGFCDSEGPDRHGILFQPARKAVRDELVRVDDHLIDDDAGRAVLRLLLRRELEPFIVGVGEIKVIDGGLSECLKVVRLNPRLDSAGHGSSCEIEITPEMIDAGADVIRFHSLEDHRATEIATLVFNAMILCRAREPAGNQ